MFYQYAQTEPFFFYSWALIITFSICLHEYAHAQVALWKGDDTAARRGHLSLNPLIQMGWSSLLMLLFVGIAWGAVPVDVRRMRGRSAAAQVAFAGPAANLLLCILFGVLHAAVFMIGMPDEVLLFMKLASMANGVLFLFNMFPVPMFDGWTVLTLFIPAMLKIDVRKASAFSWMAIIVLWTSGAFDRIWGAGAVMSGMISQFTLIVFGAA